MKSCKKILNFLGKRTPNINLWFIPLLCLHFTFISSMEKCLIPEVALVENIKDTIRSSSKKPIQRSWLTTHVPSIVTSGIICALMSQYARKTDPVWALFAQHSFAERVTHSLKDINYPLKSKNPFATFRGNMECLTFKLASIYGTWFIFELIEEQIKDSYWGFGEVCIMALMYTIGEHFTDEKHEFQKEFEHELDHILQDPEYAEKIAQSTVKTVLEKPEIVAQNIYDKELAKRLEEFKKDPAKMEQFQRAWEAQWARFVREAMDIVPRQEIATGGTASIAVDIGPQAGPADSGAGAAGAVIAEPKAGEAGSADRKGKAKVTPSTLSPELKKQLEENVGFMVELLRERAQDLHEMMKEEDKRELATLAATIKKNHTQALELQTKKKEELKLARPVAEEWIEVVVHNPEDKRDTRPTEQAVPKKTWRQWFFGESSQVTPITDDTEQGMGGTHHAPRPGGTPVAEADKDQSRAGEAATVDRAAGSGGAESAKNDGSGSGIDSDGIPLAGSGALLWDKKSLEQAALKAAGALGGGDTADERPTSALSMTTPGGYIHQPITPQAGSAGDAGAAGAGSRMLVQKALNDEPASKATVIETGGSGR